MRYVACNLATLFRDHGRTVHDQIGDQLMRLIQRCEPEVSACVAESMLEVLQERYLSEADAVVCTMGISLEAIRRSRRDVQVLEAWFATLSALVPIVPAAVLETEVCELAMEKGAVDAPVESRVACANILGAIAPKLGRAAVEKRFLGKAIEMCQDTDYAVRICMANQLANVSRAIGPEAANKMVLPEVLELVEDEERSVRLAALACIVELLGGGSKDVGGGDKKEGQAAGAAGLLPPEARYEKVLPALMALLEREVDHAVSTSTRRHSLSYVVGSENLEVSVSPDMTAELEPGVLLANAFSDVMACVVNESNANAEKAMATRNPRASAGSMVAPAAARAAQLFCALTRCRNERVREAAATVFPAVASTLVGFSSVDAEACAGLDPALRARVMLASASTRTTLYGKYLHEAFLRLAMDDVDRSEVRAAAAGSLAGMIRVLGPEGSVEHLKGLVVTFLGSKDPDVLDVLLTSAEDFEGVIMGLATSDELERRELFKELLPALLELLRNTGERRAWRHTVAVLNVLGRSSVNFPTEKVEEEVMPATMKLLLEGVTPVRDAAAKALCRMLHAHPRAAHRHDVCMRLVRNHAHAPSCAARMTFVTIVREAFGLFSNRWMRENAFTAAAVELLFDRVPNVRLAACALLPRLKAGCRAVEERELLERMTTVLARLRLDEDGDVAAAASETSARFKGVNPIGTGSIDEEDARREAREEDIKEAELRTLRASPDIVGPRDSRSFPKSGARLSLERMSSSGKSPRTSVSSESSTRGTHFARSLSSPASGRERRERRSSIGNGEIENLSRFYSSTAGERGGVKTGSSHLGTKNAQPRR